MQRNVILRMITLVLAFFMLMSPCSTLVYAEDDNTKNFADVSDSHWAKSNIYNLAKMGIVNGYEDGTFMPDKKITRGEFVHILNNAFGFNNKSNVNFNDVPISLWCYNDIAIAVNEKYTSGYPDGTFRPNNNVSRLEASTFLTRIFLRHDKKENIANSAFNDNIPEWGRDAVNYMVSRGFMKGYPDNTFKSDVAISRAEVCALIDNAIHEISKFKDLNSSDNLNDNKEDKKESKKEDSAKKKSSKHSNINDSYCPFVPERPIEPNRPDNENNFSNPLKMYSIGNDFYVFTVNKDDDAEKIKNVLGEKYSLTQNYCLGKVFKDNTKVLLYSENAKIKCDKLIDDMPQVVSGIYVDKDGEFVPLDMDQKNGAKDVKDTEDKKYNISLFVGDVKLDKPYKTSKVVLGLKGNRVSGGLDLQSNTKKIDGLNFMLGQTPSESMIYDSAISQSGNRIETISNVEIINNTFDFGVNTLSANNAIKIITALESGYLKIDNNTISGFGQSASGSSSYNNAAISVATATKDGTFTEIKNNKISGYGYHGIGVVVNEKASLSVEGNIIENVGQNGIDITLFGRGKEINVKNNIISKYGSREIKVKKSVLEKEEILSNKYEVGLGIGYTEKTVYGVKINGKYYNEKDKFLHDLLNSNTIESKEQNDKNPGVLNCTPIYFKYPERFKNPIEEINRETSRLSNEELFIVKDDDEDLVLPNESISEKMVGSIRIVGNGSGKVILNPSLKIKDNLTIDLPNANLQNNADVKKEKVNILNIRDNDFSNIVIKPEFTDIVFKRGNDLSISVLDIKNKSGENITSEKSVLENNIKVYVNGLEKTDFRVDDDNDKIILNKDLLNELLKFSTIRIEYKDDANGVSKVQKTFDISVKNSSSIKAEFENKKDAKFFEGYAPDEGIKIKLTEVKNSSGEAVDLEKINLKKNLKVKISYSSANDDEFETNGDTIIIKKSFLDKITAPAFGGLHDISLTLTDLENDVLDAQTKLKLAILNNSSMEVKPISTLTFTQGNAPESGMTFKIVSVKDSRGISLKNSQIDLENCVDIEPFPVDWKDDSIEKIGENRFRFNRKYLKLNKAENTITVTKEYLDKLQINDKDTEFGTKQIIVKYFDDRFGINLRSEKFIIHIKKALKDLSNDTKITSNNYVIENDNIKSGSAEITSKTVVSEFLKNIFKSNQRQVVRVYAEKFINNGNIAKESVYKYKKKYENISNGDYLAVTAENGKDVKLYKIVVDKTSDESLIISTDEKIISKIGESFIEIKENTTFDELKAAVKIASGAALRITNKENKNTTEIKDGYKLVIEKDGKVEERVIKIKYSKKTYRALIVANSDYGNEKLNLQGPVNDKKLMTKVFLNQEIDSNKFEKVVAIENATKKEFLDKIKETFGDSNDEDVNYLYYSGHGNNVDGISYICTVDQANDKESMVKAWISVNELRKALDEVGGTKVLIFDSCNSGGFIGKKVDAQTSPTPGTTSNINSREFNKNVERAFAINYTDRSVDYLTTNEYKVLTASSEDEYSYEDKKEKIGKFTKVLSSIAGINGKVVGDTDKDNKISLEEAYKYLEDNVVYTSHIQAFPRNDSYTIFEVGKNASAISNDTTIKSKKNAENKDNLTIIVRGKQRMIKSGEFKITNKVKVSEFLNQIVKGNEHQELKVLKFSTNSRIEKSDNEFLERLDSLEVTAEDGTKALYIITLDKIKPQVSNIKITSKKDEREIAFYTIIQNAKLIRSSIKKITEDTTVEEFLSNIEHEGELSLSVVNKSGVNKSKDMKLENGDKLLVKNKQGESAKYSIILDAKPLTLSFKDNAFKVVTSPFGNTITSGTKKLDTNVTVEEFLSLISNKEQFSNIKVNSGITYEPKKNDAKLEQGDYVLLAPKTGGFPLRFTLIIEKASIKPVQPKALGPDFGDDFEVDISSPYNLKIKSKNTKILETMTVSQFVSKLKNKDKFDDVKIKRGWDELKENSTLKDGDKLFLTFKKSNLGLGSVSETKQYTIELYKEVEIKEPDFGGAYQIGKLKKNEIIGGTETLTTDITVAEFIGKIRNHDDYDSIKIQKAYEEVIKQDSDKIESDDKLILKKGSKELIYKLTNVTDAGGGIVIPIN